LCLIFFFFFFFFVISPSADVWWFPCCTGEPAYTQHRNEKWGQ